MNDELSTCVISICSLRHEHVWKLTSQLLPRFIQAQEFTKVTEITSLAITKLDGTAKGGVVIGISDQFKIPVKYIGVGEKISDLQVFNKTAFVESIFAKK